MPVRFTLLTLAAASLALAACEREPNEPELTKLDNQLVKDADPAVTNALEDQILVDPALTQQSNKLAARPPASPPQAQYPVPDGPSGKAAATAQPRPAGAPHDGIGNECLAQFDYGNAWANRLPAEFAVYPGARITEAAGNNRGDCRMRVVTFASADPPQRLLDWYRDRAVRAGYSAERQARGSDQVLAGTQGEAAFFLVVSPAARGSEGALIVNNGR